MFASASVLASVCRVVGIGMLASVDPSSHQIIIPLTNIMRKLTLFIFINALSCFAIENPNVIILITDDQGYGDLSCHGHPILETPSFDESYTGIAFAWTIFTSRLSARRLEANL